MTLKANPMVSDICIGSFHSCHERSICEAACLSLGWHQCKLRSRGAIIDLTALDVGIIKCSAPIFMRKMFATNFRGLATSIRNWNKSRIQMGSASLPESQIEGHPGLIQLDSRQL